MENQAYIFLLFILNGILIGMLFDMFRILRRSFKTADSITYIEDILFWLLTGFMTLYFIFTFNHGEIRGYLFIGILLGIVLYMVSLSKYIIKVSVTIITFFKTVIGKIIHFVLAPFRFLFNIIKKLFLRPISFIFINLRKQITKNTNNLQKMLLKMQKLPKKDERKKDLS